MILPEFDHEGDLPIGIHRATLDQIVERFGGATRQRQAVTATLLRIYALVQATGSLQRFLVFGSYVTEKPSPNDLDLFLVMTRSFDVEDCDGPARNIFSHDLAESDFGASVFWATEATSRELIEDLIGGWQSNRSGKLRGMVEVVE